ncbi:hypothetical protein KBY58_02065 [Cyanobium sp. HWJ4-Hawea]|nr:hypothetical protein [Cyanobium sp. HWJ4-Hawea]
MLRTTRVFCGAALSLAALLTPAVIPAMGLQAARAQQPQPVDNALTIAGVQGVLNKGDQAAASGNLTEARRQYDLARDYTRKLLGFYRDLSGSFRGLDARIPREMDQKGREALETLAQANLRLAAVFRRQNQSEVAVPLLVEVVKVMTPASPEGRKAYQSLVELGFASTPYTAGQVLDAVPAAGK